MKKVFKVSVALFACLLATLQLSAQEYDTSAVVADSVFFYKDAVATAANIPSDFSKTTRSISVITQDQIKALPVRSINEVLQHVIGVDVRQRGPAGVQADISIRGENFENVLILLNGVKMNDPQTGHHNLNLPVPMEDIERIEILRGPAARIHGQNAFSGVVNIITKTGNQRKLFLKGEAGDFGYLGGVASLSLPIKNYTQRISVSRNVSSGYRENTDFTISNVFYQSALNFDRGKLNFAGGFSDKQFGANAFYAATFPRQYEETQTYFAHAGAEHGNDSFSLKGNLYFRQHNDRFLLKRENPEFYENLHTTYVSGGDVNSSLKWKGGQTYIGAEVRREDISSTMLGDTINKFGERQRLNAGVFAEHKVIIAEKLVITPGVYIGWFTNYGLQWYPGADAGYFITPELTVYASAGRSFRVPSYTELFYSDPANLGNENLLPETAVNYETGLRYMQKKFTANIGIARKQGTNIIDWVKEDLNDPWQVVNIAEITTTTIEAGADFNIGRLLNKPGFFIKRAGIGYAWLTTEKAEQAFASKYVFDYLRHKLNIHLQHKLPLGLAATWNTRYEDRVGFTPYWVLDAKLSRKVKSFDFFIEGTNLLNQRYYEIANVPMAGRWVTGGISWNGIF